MAKIRTALGLLARPFPAREVTQVRAPNMPALVRFVDAQWC